MNKNLTVGFVTTFSGRWPQEVPRQRMEEYGAWLEENLTGVRLVKAEGMGSSTEAVANIVEGFRSAGVDLVVMLYGAFTGDDVSSYIAQELQAPIVLWAPYEVPFEKNTRLFSNGLCSAMMNAAVLKRLGHTAYVVYGSKEDPRATRELLELISAYNVKRKMSQTLLGLLGYRPTAFYNCAVDEFLIRKTFGVRIEETDLKVVFDKMAQLPQEAVTAEMDRVGRLWDASHLPQGHLENHARLYLALKDTMAQQGYEFATIKCWPEMGNLHTTPCAVMGRLADEGFHIGCEGDVDAELAQIAQNYFTGLPTFVTDMINIDEEQNTMTFWHCGNSAPSLHNPKYEVSLENHPLAGQGSAFWAALKPGPVTVARFCNLKEGYKLFVLRGEAVDSDRYTRGSMVNVKIATPVRQAVDRMIAAGVPHHTSVVWADIADRMVRLAGLLGIEVIEIN